VILRDPEALSLLAWGRGFLPGRQRGTKSPTRRGHPTDDRSQTP